MLAPSELLVDEAVGDAASPHQIGLRPIWRALAFTFKNGVKVPPATPNNLPSK